MNYCPSMQIYSSNIVLSSNHKHLEVLIDMLVLSFISFVTQYISLSNSTSHAANLRLSKDNVEAMFF